VQRSQPFLVATAAKQERTYTTGAHKIYKGIQKATKAGFQSICFLDLVFSI
jgi:hypothetical protein